MKWDPVGTLLDAVEGLGFEELGRSVEGRPIRGRRFGAPGPSLLVFGGIHGDEPASVEALIELAHPLAAGGKNSARDVDLNRNFPARSFTTQHAPGYFPGPAPLSEPETRVITDLLAREPIAAVVAVHAPFACVNHDGPAAAWAAAVAAACGWPARAALGYPTPGSLGGWLGIDRGLPVLTLELPPGPLSRFRDQAAAALNEAIRAAPVEPEV